MSYEIPGFSFTLAAGEDLTEYQFRFMDITDEGKAVPATAAGKAVGVLNNKPTEDDACTIVHNGIIQVEADDAIDAGALVEAVGTTTERGRAVTRTSGIALGVALQSASAAGAIIPVLLIPNVV